MKFKRNKNKEKKESTVVMGTLNDINKTIVEQQIEPLSEEELLQKIKLVEDFIKDTNNKYYMLLCNERKDYTVFHRNVNRLGQYYDICVGFMGERIQTTLINEILPNRGVIKSIELTDAKDGIEIWLSIDKESFCYYFFPYEQAVIEL